MSSISSFLITDQDIREINEHLSTPDKILKKLVCCLNLTSEDKKESFVLLKRSLKALKAANLGNVENPKVLSELVDSLVQYVIPDYPLGLLREIFGILQRIGRCDDHSTLPEEKVTHLLVAVAEVLPHLQDFSIQELAMSVLLDFDGFRNDACLQVVSSLFSPESEVQFLLYNFDDCLFDPQSRLILNSVNLASNVNDRVESYVAFTVEGDSVSFLPPEGCLLWIDFNPGFGSISFPFGFCNVNQKLVKVGKSTIIIKEKIVSNYSVSYGKVLKKFRVTLDPPLKIPREESSSDISIQYLVLTFRKKVAFEDSLKHVYKNVPCEWPSPKVGRREEHTDESYSTETEVNDSDNTTELCNESDDENKVSSPVACETGFSDSDEESDKRHRHLETTYNNSFVSSGSADWDTFMSSQETKDDSGFQESVYKKGGQNDPAVSVPSEDGSHCADDGGETDLSRDSSLCSSKDAQSVVLDEVQKTTKIDEISSQSQATSKYQNRQQQFDITQRVLPFNHGEGNPSDHTAIDPLENIDDCDSKESTSDISNQNRSTQLLSQEIDQGDLSDDSDIYIYPTEVRNPVSEAQKSSSAAQSKSSSAYEIYRDLVSSGTVTENRSTPVSITEADSDDEVVIIEERVNVASIQDSETHGSDAEFQCEGDVMKICKSDRTADRKESFYSSKEEILQEWSRNLSPEEFPLEKTKESNEHSTNRGGILEYSFIDVSQVTIGELNLSPCTLAKSSKDSPDTKQCKKHRHEPKNRRGTECTGELKYSKITCEAGSAPEVKDKITEQATKSNVECDQIIETENTDSSSLPSTSGMKEQRRWKYNLRQRSNIPNLNSASFMVPPKNPTKTGQSAKNIHNSSSSFAPKDRVPNRRRKKTASKSSKSASKQGENVAKQTSGRKAKTKGIQTEESSLSPRMCQRARQNTTQETVLSFNVDDYDFPPSSIELRFTRNTRQLVAPAVQQQQPPRLRSTRHNLKRKSKSLEHIPSYDEAQCSQNGPTLMQPHPPCKSARKFFKSSSLPLFGRHLRKIPSLNVATDRVYTYKLFPHQKPVLLERVYCDWKF